MISMHVENLKRLCECVNLPKSYSCSLAKLYPDPCCRITEYIQATSPPRSFAGPTERRRDDKPISTVYRSVIPIQYLIVIQKSRTTRRRFRSSRCYPLMSDQRFDRRSDMVYRYVALTIVLRGLFVANTISSVNGTLHPNLYGKHRDWVTLHGV